MFFKDLLKGVSLILILWIVNTLIAFLVFRPIEEHTLWIILSWVLVDIWIYLFLNRNGFINKKVNPFAILTILILIILYLVPINDNIPHEAINLNILLSEDNEDRYEYAESLFWEIEKKYDIEIRDYLLYPNRVFFLKDFSKIWNTKGYIDSNLQAQVYYKLLLGSGKFDDKEILLQKNNFCTNSPHTLVYFKEKNIYADFFASDYFEEYKWGQYARYPCNSLT